jgi:hypothetical protein
MQCDNASYVVTTFSSSYPLINSAKKMFICLQPHPPASPVILRPNTTISPLKDGEIRGQVFVNGQVRAAMAYQDEECNENPGPDEDLKSYFRCSVV